MDEIIKQYADRLQKIYDERLAGDHSFSGVLSEFLEDIGKSCQSSEELIRRHHVYQHGAYRNGEH